MYLLAWEEVGEEVQRLSKRLSLEKGNKITGWKAEAVKFLTGF